VPQSDSEAARWYHEAASQGDAHAQSKLGLWLARGGKLGVGSDDAAAVQWWRNAAEQGHANAQFNLGLMHAQAIKLCLFSYLD